MKKSGIKKIVSFATSVLMTVGIAGFAGTGCVKAAGVTTNIVNGDFCTGIWDDNAGWTVSSTTWENQTIATYEYATNEWMTAPADGSEYGVNIWYQDGGTASFSQIINIAEGETDFSAMVMGEKATLTLSVGEDYSTSVSLSGWNTWDAVDVEFMAEDDLTDVTIDVSIECEAGGYAYLNSVTAEHINENPDEVIREFDFDTTPVDMEAMDSDLVCEKVDGMATDFITGFDISSYLSITESGATFKDFEGNELDHAGFFDLLKENGVNWVRLRVWVDPTNEEGKTYGGGNCDVETAKKIGRWASDAGIRVLIDFHYSDFWTDPGKQTAPKAWAEMNLEEKAATLKAWTVGSLTEIIDAGVDVGMVQVGNETTTGFCGEKDMPNMCTLFKAGSEGVQEVEKAMDKKIMIAIHLTNPDKINFNSYAKSLKDNGVVYDVFATSYYPYWHGTLENLESKLSDIASTYGKYVMVAETSYARTLDDGDGWENTESVKKLESDTFPYEISEQGQINHFRNVIKTVSGIDDNKGIGVFWWEPAWIPVQNYADAEDKEAVLAENKEIWDEKGSGWATIAAADYDKNVGEWYGGSAVDNESVFDFDGKALESLKVFNLVRAGSKAENGISELVDAEATFEEGEEIVLPETVKVVYKDGTEEEAEVIWNKTETEAVSKAGIGEYEISGKVNYNEEEFEVHCKVTVTYANLLRDKNFDFEKGDADWTITGEASDNLINGTDVRGGSYGYHFWNDTDFTCGIEQKITLDAGTYTFGGYIQGGDCGDAAEIYIYVDMGDTKPVSAVALTGWNDWKNPEIEKFTVEEDGTEVTIGLNVTAAGGGWGTADDFYLYRIGDTDTEWPFADVAESDNGANEMLAAYERGILSGFPAGEEGLVNVKPMNKTTRAQFAIMLYRMAVSEGRIEEGTSGTGSFTDVKEGQSGYDAIMWASENHIINGYPNGKFKPESYITRAQITLMLKNYADHFGIDTSARSEEISELSDYAEVTESFRDGVSWAFAKGIISGKIKNGVVVIAPNDYATRAQCSMFIIRFLNE